MTVAPSAASIGFPQTGRSPGDNRNLPLYSTHFVSNPFVGPYLAKWSRRPIFLAQEP